MKRATASLLYQSPNGDTWFLARDPRTGLAFVRHEASTPSGGQVTDLEIGAFLNRPRNPEQDALFRAIGVLLLGPKEAGAGDEQSGAGTRGEWSDAQLSELGYMLLRGLLVEEIARLLGRNRDDVQDKIVEIGRAAG